MALPHRGARRGALRHRRLLRTAARDRWHGRSPPRRARLLGATGRTGLWTVRPRADRYVALGLEEGLLDGPLTTRDLRGTLGTSMEDERVLGRVDDLRRTGAAVKFLSCEPLIGPLPNLNLDGIDWVIVGGESGPGARPMEREWVTEIRGRCVEAGVPWFFKQWGGTNKKATGRELDGRTYEEYPRPLVGA